jgi:hypothetical protein
MPSDDRAVELDGLRRRFPRWTIWFGLFSGHWWALPPLDRDVGDFIEAETAQKLLARIEMIQQSRGSGPWPERSSVPPREPVVAWQGHPAPWPTGSATTPRGDRAMVPSPPGSHRTITGFMHSGPAGSGHRVP